MRLSKSCRICDSVFSRTYYVALFSRESLASDLANRLSKVARVLHATAQAIVADPQCTDLTSNCWYLDDGVLAGTRASLITTLEVNQEQSVSSGLSLNYSKCELLYSLQNLDMLYHTISRSATPCLEILGAPIGTLEFCVEYIQKKIAEARQLLHLHPQLCETQVALSLLRMCGSFCKMAHLARTIHPPQIFLSVSFNSTGTVCIALEPQHLLH